MSFKLNADGMRVIAVAQETNQAPAGQLYTADETDMVLIGFPVDELLLGLNLDDMTDEALAKKEETTASSNFGTMFSVLAASAFLPFLPMASIHLIVLNLICNLSGGLRRAAVSPDHRCKDDGRLYGFGNCDETFVRQEVWGIIVKGTQRCRLDFIVDLQRFFGV